VPIVEHTRLADDFFDEGGQFDAFLREADPVAVAARQKK
jgi:hypothetical protein